MSLCSVGARRLPIPQLAVLARPAARNLATDATVDDYIPPQQQKSTAVNVKGSSYMIEKFGDPVAKTPFRVHLEAGKKYAWCACGFSRTQPFCDGSHNEMGLTVLRPVVFEAKRTGEHALCACKQTSHRPMCDGKHKTLPAGPLEIDIPLVPLVAFDMNDPNSYVTRGVAKKLGLRERDGQFNYHNRKPNAVVRKTV